MTIKILLILTQILAFIKINGGMNYTWEEDEQDSYFRLADFSGGPPSPGEEMFRELFGTPVDQVNTEIQGESSTAEIRNVPVIEKTKDTWDQDSCFQNNDFSGEPTSPSEEIFPERFNTPVNQINKEIHGESSTAGIQNVPADKNTRETWAQDIFLQEYQRMKKYQSWNDLRNDAYVESWPIFCHQLWDKHPNMKRGQECGATRIYEPLLHRVLYRVNTPNRNRYLVDLLKCKCPENSTLPAKLQRVSNSELYFFVTPCAAFSNSYYIMRQGRVLSLEVFDIRNTTFTPACDIHILGNETNVQTYGQPGTIGSQNEQKDGMEMEKKAKDTFLKEYLLYVPKKKLWSDLRNKTYTKSWPKLCLLLWDIEPDKKTGVNCETIILSKFNNHRMAYRITDPSVYNKMYADLLLCKCAKSAPFYVTKSYKIDNTYFIMTTKSKGSTDIEVYDMRSVAFNPSSNNTQ